MRSRRGNITDADWHVLKAVHQWEQEHSRVCPTADDIASIAGKSRVTVFENLRHLVAAGFLLGDTRRPRTLYLSQTARQMLEGEGVR